MTKLLIFSSITMAIIIGILIFCGLRIKNQKTKDIFLKVSAILTVFIHYSILWVDYLQTGKASVDGTMLFPIYPCNICMWLLLIVAFVENKKSFFINTLMEFLAVAGSVCGLIGLFANEIFLSDPDFFDYSSLKGLLSHATMIFGTLFILTQGYVKIKAPTLARSTAIGLILFIIIGGIINLTYHIFNLDPVNAMFMLEFPIDIPFVNFFTLGFVGLLVAFMIGHIYELIFISKEDRWYKKLQNKKYKGENK